MVVFQLMLEQPGGAGFELGFACQHELLVNEIRLRRMGGVNFRDRLRRLLVPVSYLGFQTH
ncbi:hypothetical protein SAMN05877838_3836 [Hoeflea halophila]|uniref:Uncharacterized protein n=1 Tax=Hoeflea halophila TaxID=714899 RepID=A0A286IFQ1_9HYPH|nr:hypothetical protein SAMN05877838_3836 [Hoeflea halophila]